MELKPYDYQLRLAKEGSSILSKHNIVYLAMEERTGKSLVSLLMVENSPIYNKALIITKKKALEGWVNTLTGAESWLKKKYILMNYHSLHKLDKSASFDIIILDEAHAYISSYPRKSMIWNKVKPICLDRHIIFMSATPYAQGIQLLYHQLALSSYSIWKSYKNFYVWYRNYAERDKNGDTEAIWINGRRIETYKKVDYSKAIKDVEHLFITKTRKSLGFMFEPKDVIHYLDLNDNTKLAYNTLIKKGVLDFKANDRDYTLVADSKLKLRTALHMLEGGVLKIDKEYIILKNDEKIHYILDKWGDSSNIAIMYQYIAEGKKLNAVFKNALLLQSTSYAEGIDLSHIEHLIVYSQDFSTAKHTQRRARQANINRLQDIEVNFLLVKKAVSEQVYTAVSKNKVNFVDKLFEQEGI